MNLNEQTVCPICDGEGTFTVLRPNWRNLPPPAEQKAYCNCALGTRLWEQLDEQAQKASAHVSASQTIFALAGAELDHHLKNEERDYLAYRVKWGLE